jgi:HlyD family secretion protein
MKGRLIVGTVLAGLCVAGFVGRLESGAPQGSGALTPLINGDYAVAAPARIEPVSEEVRIGTSLNAVIKEMLVKEGEAVERNQVIAVLESAEQAASLAKAEAALKLREAELARVMNGARTQERNQALATVQETEAVLRNAAADLERRRKLLQTNNVAQEQADRAEREYSVAQKRHTAAVQQYSLITERARPEDIAIAEAQVSLARAARDEAKAQLEKTSIRSPIAGTVLKLHRRAGELVSIFFDLPIATIGDVSRLHARAEVDEADIARLSVGMPAYVTADAFGSRRFAGQVVRIGQSIGKKNIRTDEPKERLDTKVLETLIELEPGAPLLPGLRANAFILPSKTAEAR